VCGTNASSTQLLSTVKQIVNSESCARTRTHVYTHRIRIMGSWKPADRLCTCVVASRLLLLLLKIILLWHTAALSEPRAVDNNDIIIFVITTWGGRPGVRTTKWRTVRRVHRRSVISCCCTCSILLRLLFSVSLNRPRSPFAGGSYLYVLRYKLIYKYTILYNIHINIIL